MLHKQDNVDILIDFSNLQNCMKSLGCQKIFHKQHFFASIGMRLSGD